MKMNETNGIIKQIRGMRQKNVTVETVDLRRLHKMHLYHSCKYCIFKMREQTIAFFSNETYETNEII